MIGNTIDMPRVNKGDFILSNIPVDLPEVRINIYIYKCIYYILFNE